MRARSVVLRAEGAGGPLQVRIGVRLLRELLRDGKAVLVGIGPASDAPEEASLADLLAGSVALVCKTPAPPSAPVMVECTNVLLDVRPSND